MKRRKRKNEFKTKKLNLQTHQARLKAIPADGRTGFLWLLFAAGMMAILSLLWLRK